MKRCGPEVAAKPAPERCVSKDAPAPADFTVGCAAPASVNTWTTPPAALP
jgi:hypothetical protein